MRISPLFDIPQFAKKISRVIPGLLMALPGLLFGQFSFQQMSEPGGLFSTTSQNYDHNTSVETRTISTQYSDYIFTHWTVNGVRQVDGNGQALHKIKFAITSNTVAVANYLNKDQDSDSDNISDWIEIKYSSNLNANAQTDSDGDGIVLRDEVNLGLVPSIDDNISEGGISSRRSKLMAVNLGGAKKLTLKSDPVGLIASTSNLLENNSSFETVTLNGLKNGYYFSHWEVNGVRVSDNKGVGVAQVSQSMNEDKVVVAKYFPEDMDSDNDNIPDWYESHYFGGLGKNQESDPDGDGFILGEELKLGLSSVIDDNISEGGISVRRSAKVIVNLGGASKVTIKSTPPGLISSSVFYPEVNSTYTTSVLSGLKNGFYFSHWEVNGVRQADSTGLGLSQVIQTLDNDKRFIAKYYAENEDLDDDDIPDWFEWHEQGSLDLNGSSDPDGDGFSLADEKKLGLSSNIVDQIAAGGVSQRRSANFSYLRDANDPTDTDGDGLTDSKEISIGTNFRLVDTDGDGFSDFEEFEDGTNPLLATSFRNIAPTDIRSSQQLTILENQPVGTFVGLLSAIDPNDLSFSDAYVFSLVDGNRSSGNQSFNLESNGTLLSAQVFDYEKLLDGNGTSLSIRVRVTDPGNLFTEGNLTVSVINVFEDNDSDGIEDSSDPDDDNDGFSDQAEIAYGSDPLDSKSVANKAPSFLDLNGSFIEENQPIGTRVGQLLSEDPDSNSSLAFRLVDGNGSKNNNVFIIDENASIRTNAMFDYETDEHNYSIRVRVSDEHNFSIDQSFVISLVDANEAPFDIDYILPLVVSENKPEGTIVGIVEAADLDQNDTLTYQLLDAGDYLGDDYFYLESNGTLKTSLVLDFETLKLQNDHFLTIKVSVSDSGGLSTEQSFFVKILNIVEDNDVDGIEDYYDPDDDNDGFSDQAEITYGSDPFDVKSVANKAPNFLDLNGSSIEENQLVGTSVGQLLAQDPDDNTSLTFRLVDGNGSTNNHLFTIDENASVHTKTIFDYETDEHNYSIRVEVVDEHNFSMQKSFVINLINVIEDNDGDEIEDYYDPDDDNDGFTDQAEIAFGSDPFDKESKINRPPTGMEIMDLNFSENMPSGSLIGKVLASDPDANESLKYSNLTKDENGTKELFLLQEDGHLYTSYIFDFETNESLYSLTLRVTDRYGETLDKTFEIELGNIIEDIDNDGVEDYYDPDIDGDGFANELEIKDGTDPLDDQSHPSYPVLSLESGRVDSDAGSITLSATVQHDGDGILEDIGFILSPILETDSEESIRISENNWNTFEWVDSFKILEGENKHTFELFIQESPFDKTFYFRAWAENSAGVGMSSVKKLQLQISELPWVNDLIEETGGWFSSSWFGLFKPYPNQWIYHAGLGWVYASSTKDESVWIWREGEGWMWTNQQTWPFLWSDQTGNWLYLIRGKIGPPIFFDYSQNSYISDTVE
jgi:hypothetical protein